MRRPLSKAHRGRVLRPRERQVLVHRLLRQVRHGLRERKRSDRVAKPAATKRDELAAKRRQVTE